MNLKQIFKNINFMVFCVPLSIDDLGLVFLNDNDVFNIIINTKHPKYQNQSILVSELKDILKTKSSARPNKEQACEAKCTAMLAILEAFDDNEPIELD